MSTLPQTAWEQTVDEAQKACNSVFGEGLDADGNGQIIYTHAGGSAFALDGIFEAQSEVIDFGNEFQTVSYQPMLSAAVSAFQQVPKAGDSCVIRGISYRVIDPRFDGQGTVTLRMHEL